MFESYQYFGCQETCTDIVHHLGKSVVMFFADFDLQTRFLKIGFIGIERLRSSDTGHPGEQSSQIFRQLTTAYDIGHAELTNRLEHAGKLTSGSGLIREGTERTFADESIKGFGLEWEMLRITLFEIDALTTPTAFAAAFAASTAALP